MKDPELLAMSAIQREIFKLAPGVRKRVLAWIASKEADGSWTQAPTPPPSEGPSSAAVSATPAAN